MTDDDPISIADEQLRYWQAAGWTPEMAWRALTNNPERNRATWPLVWRFLVRWLCEQERENRQLKLRLAA